ncbi:hypothetical protein [Paenibacillus polymyxa]|uniref:hypothetical protein n=1 Tax=Paenibacillus polymyxa TaxID=1406 RepID=UPI000C9F39A6|nr:hypothetical protein [Paenibacillus polymyxa]AUS26741.1 hypothetical protein C1A50_2574 [Paenibacillus polymyxa]
MNEKCGVQTMQELLFGTPPKDVDDEVFLKVRSSYHACLSLIWIEEKFNMVSANYYEWEEQIKESYDFFLANQNDKQDCAEKFQNFGMAQVVVLNRRLNNLLNTIRLYRDQVLHGLSLLEKQLLVSDLKIEFEKETNKLYDESVSYQLMEFIRNYMQHQGLIVERITAIIPLFSRTVGSQLPYFVELNYKELKKIDKFNNKIKLKEKLDKQGEWLNLILVVREYYTQIIRLHNKYREITAQIYATASQDITVILGEYYGNILVKEVAFYGRKDKDEYKDFLVQLTYVDKLKIYRHSLAELEESRSYINKTVFIESDKVRCGNSTTCSIRYNM